MVYKSILILFVANSTSEIMLKQETEIVITRVLEYIDGHNDINRILMFKSMKFHLYDKLILLSSVFTISNVIKISDKCKIVS